MTPTLLDYRIALTARGDASDAAARRAATQAAQRLRTTIYGDCSRQTLERRLDPARNADDESMLWFWFNHFNVYWKKGLVGAALPSYLDEALRPHLHGRFRDVLLAATTHPAMLSYLDNVRNVDGRLNENLARELLELHTLGVDGGYTQTDVQETARLLTGFGLRPVHRSGPRAPTDRRAVERGEFLFEPGHHDFGAKTILGQRIEGKGYAEIEVLADMLALHPATARHLARQVCLYRLGDAVPPGVEAAAAQAYLDSGGKLDALVGATVAASRATGAAAAGSFKDPMRWLIGGVALLADGRPVTDATPLARWLGVLGQPLFGRTTPDGYSMRGADWVSAGQLTQRFELAQDIVASLPRLLGPSAGTVDLQAVAASAGVRALQATLGPKSRASIDAASVPAERLALLLASPEFMYA